MQIRFQVKGNNGQLLEVTEWQEEHSRDVAVAAVRDLRRLHGPDAAIFIERSGVEPTVNPTQVRFRIVDGDSTYYSAMFPIGEKVQRQSEMRVKFPKATIEAQETR